VVGDAPGLLRGIDAGIRCGAGLLAPSSKFSRWTFALEAPQSAADEIIDRFVCAAPK